MITIRVYTVAKPKSAPKRKRAAVNYYNEHDKFAAMSRGADGRTRPVDPRPYSLGYGVSSRVAFNRAYGNAICPQTAAAFIGAWLEASQELRAAA